MLGYMVRINLSIAIVAMVGSKPSNDTNNFTEVCTYPDEEVEQHYIEGDLDWDEKTQGLVLGSFFYGYTASNFMWGRAAEYLGGRLVFGLGVVVPSVLSLFSALCASVSKDLFIVLRVLEGLAQGSLYPASSFLLTAWIPPKELTSYGAYVFSGATFGTIVALGSGGWLCDSEFLGGWPSIFYVFGVLGVLWGLPWFLMVHDLPEQHPNIDSTELTYITTHRTFVKQDKNVSLPVLEIVKSVPFWSVMVVSFGYNYITYLLLTETPTYFANIQHVNLANNGYISGLLYAVQFLLLIAWGAFLAILSDKNLISVNISRKLSTALGMYVPAVAMIAMMWVDCNNTLAMVVMGIGIGANGLVVSGAEISPNDISPNFAGSIKGISNTVGAMTGFVAPLITGLIINNNQTLRAWNTVFVIGAVVSSIPATHFLIWGTDKVQPWNEPTPKTKQSVTSRTE
ncbi:hypothetical protein Pmani_035084 [Petrolisthes manimaculis]|uniref:Major facilitator superfamily (MFS) profile domain-containing protein n=1 Tax=Petrolisthes manimaculis TaxID=1843537 RepID=A0AAE1NLC2_9EUCA|nr:hypothetical protein Pmani_035084 [Petrolisthes manimaculis]